MRQKESTRREARDALRESESAVSDLTRELRALEVRTRDARLQLDALDARRRAASELLARRQAALERILEARYRGGAPEIVRIALSGDDPNDTARHIHYVSIVSAAAVRMVNEVRDALAALDTLKRSHAEQAAALDGLERERRADRDRLLAGQRERRRVLDAIAGDLRQDRGRLRTLESDAARLGRIVAEVSRVLHVRQGAAAVAGTVPPGPETQAGPFSRQRGKLRLPVSGELIGRFGAQHGEGAGARKGIFIRTREGEPVRAVAAGTVVFADWMRGLGNLLILDHGESYLSVYANNEALLKQPGEAVAAGDPVATVGATGGNEQTGLYFELRHLGEAFDPLGWVAR